MTMNQTVQIPKPLQPGDCIGVVAPAGQLRDTEALAKGVAIIQEMGFELKLPRNLWPGNGYLADTDRNRAVEFHRMWADPGVSALLALRGGFGSLRLLPFLSPTEIRKENKLFIGFSDITILLQALLQTNKLMSLHGPVLCSLADMNRDSLRNFYACVTGNWDKALVLPQVEVLRGGDMVRGRLIGGNLSSLISTLATGADQDWKDSIVFLEDVGEPLYRIDRMLTQLWHCGKLGEAAGFLLGDFSLREQDSLEKIRFHEAIWKRFLELTEAAQQPVWGNFPVGHGSENLSLPYGAMAAMDSSRATLSFR